MEKCRWLEGREQLECKSPTSTCWGLFLRVSKIKPKNLHELALCNCLTCTTSKDCVPFREKIKSSRFSSRPKQYRKRSNIYRLAVRLDAIWQWVTIHRMYCCKWLGHSFFSFKCGKLMFPFYISFLFSLRVKIWLSCNQRILHFRRVNYILHLFDLQNNLVHMLYKYEGIQITNCYTTVLYLPNYESLF